MTRGAHMTEREVSVVGRYWYMSACGEFEASYVWVVRNVLNGHMNFVVVIN